MKILVRLLIILLLPLSIKGQTDKYFIEQSGMDFLSDSIYEKEYSGYKICYDGLIFGQNISKEYFDYSLCNFWPKPDSIEIKNVINIYNLNNDTVSGVLSIKKPIKNCDKYKYSKSPRNKIEWKLRDLKIILFKNKYYIKVSQALEYKGNYYMTIKTFNKRVAIGMIHYLKISKDGEILMYESDFINY